jgi:hypothetical protein
MAERAMLQAKMSCWRMVPELLKGLIVYLKKGMSWTGKSDGCSQSEILLR